MKDILKVRNRTTDQGNYYTKGYVLHYQHFRGLEVVLSIGKNNLLPLRLRAAALLADGGMKKIVNNAITHATSKMIFQKLKAQNSRLQHIIS